MKILNLPDPTEALPGRAENMPVSHTHFITGNPIKPPFPDNQKMAMFGLGQARAAQGDLIGAALAYQDAVTSTADPDSITILAMDTLNEITSAQSPRPDISASRRSTSTGHSRPATRQLDSESKSNRSRTPIRRQT